MRPETNQVVVGAADLLGVNAITGHHARWCGPAPEGVVRVGAQVRAHGEEHAATAWADGDRVEVRLDERVRGVAPGQSVVLYDGTRVVGSATIAGPVAPERGAAPGTGLPDAGMRIARSNWGVRSELVRAEPSVVEEGRVVRGGQVASGRPRC